MQEKLEKNITCHLNLLSHNELSLSFKILVWISKNIKCKKTKKTNSSYDIKRQHQTIEVQKNKSLVSNSKIYFHLSFVVLLLWKLKESFKSYLVLLSHMVGIPFVCAFTLHRGGIYQFFVCSIHYSHFRKLKERKRGKSHTVHWMSWIWKSFVIDANIHISPNTYHISRML
jgi:hypothetical protein